MAQPMTNDEWEICKLATDERYEGHGAGSAVFFKACMDLCLGKQVPINLQSCQTVF